MISQYKIKESYKLENTPYEIWNWIIWSK